MPRNGSGTYNLPGGNPVVTQTLITSSWANTTMADLAAAISQSLSKDGQTVPTANLPMGGFRHTGAGDPADRTSYQTLGAAQDGKESRVTTVAGTNTITGNLPGSPSALVTGMRVQLIPVVNNTGPATLNINGTGNKAITTTAGSPLIAGVLLAGKPYELMYDGTKFVILAGSSGAFAQAAVSGWDRPSDGTYDALAIVDPSTISIPAGTGRIVAPGSRDETGVTEVSWAAQNVPLSHLASSWVTQVGINAAGTVVQIAGELLPEHFRDLIILGSAVHVNGAVTSVNLTPSVYGDAAYAAADVASVLRNTILSGMGLAANGANLKLDVAVGTLFLPGGDPNDADSPNIAPYAARAAVSFHMIRGNSASAAAVTDLPVTFYDPNGAGTPTTLAAATGTAIHRVYQLSGQILVLYGQNEYADLATATASLQADTADTVFPTKLADAVLLGYIIAQKDATALNDAAKATVLSAANASSGTGGGGGGLTDAPTDGTLYGRKDGNWAQGLEAPSGAAGTDRTITYFTLTSPRWEQGANSTAEGGSNAGSDWKLEAYDDSGASLGTAMAVTRSTLGATFYGNMNLARTTLPSYDWTSSGNAADNKRGRVVLDNSGNMLIQTLNDDGSTKSEASLHGTGELKVATNTVWHEGNFDPATKANVGAGGGAADSLAPGRLIGGVHFDGTANINLPGVNIAGNQNTTGSAASLTTSRNINGTAFNGTGNITTASWGTGRTLTVGLTGKTIDGSSNVSWSLAEIGAIGAASPTFTGTVSGVNSTWSGTLGVTGISTLGALNATNVAFSGTSSHTGAATFGTTVGITGNTTVGGTLGITGTTTATVVNGTNSTWSGTLGVTGLSTLAALNATNVAFSGTSSHTGNATFGGTLGVTGAATLAAMTATTGGFSSNVTVGGTLGVTGTATMGVLNSGNHAITGTLSASGTSTLGVLNSGNHAVTGTLSASGATTLAAVSATTGTFSSTVTATDLTATSDARFKDNVQDFKLRRSLRPREYDRNDMDGRHDFGFIAQEVEQDYPEAVHTDNDGIKSVSYTRLVAVLMAEILDLKQRVTDLGG